MSNFKNMKIPVENNLDEIVGELESKGYVRISWWGGERAKFIVTNTEKRYTDIDYDSPNFKLTTLPELKEVFYEGE